MTTLTILAVAEFEHHGTHHVIFEAGNDRFDVVAQSAEDIGSDHGTTVTTFNCPRAASFDALVRRARGSLS
ncbi:hypothetical protein [Leifsonia sp. Leaf264]|uniref:hypothetical protein n=1 Tax=Leifsonia sp. Leaf264 TaxID=1736314 RepID=UPI0006FCC972|nr:hypothetical protein [Leifsonia sp. Leaf264]KQO98753.1 hypothetical protein ASF30_11875 [Leifsonia sp. Leaf264]